MNLMFLIDIIINFISAFYDTDFNIVDDYKVRKEQKNIQVKKPLSNNLIL